MNVKKIYAPCDGEVFEISKLNDGVFSNKMLGDGIYIKPSSEVFSSIIDEGKMLQVFDTKHAYFFEVEKNFPPILMHIGLETVTLNGVPFNTFIENDTKVDLKSKIVKADLKYILKNKCKIETAIVLETNQEFDLKIIKTGKVKQGDLIMEVNQLEVKKQKDNNPVSPVSFAGKYDVIAKTVYDNVGGEKNFKDFSNCMTRLRLDVIDKSQVNEDVIKKIPIVKGVNWAGNELQIIVGGEVYKVKDAFGQYLLNKDKTSSTEVIPVTFKTKLMSFIQAVVIPMIPALIGGSMLQAFYTIFGDQLIGLYQAIPGGTFGTALLDYHWANVMFYIIAYPGTAFVGIFFLYNTIKYLGGNTVVAVLIGVTLISPYLFSGIEIVWFTLKVGQIQANFGIKGYPTSVIPLVAAGFLYYYTDKFIKTWMPTSVDIIFRHSLAVLFTCSMTFMVLGNALSVIELTIGYLISLFAYIPFGLGTAMFAFIWQPLVLTGAHSAVWTAVALPALNNSAVGIPVLFGTVFGVFGQMGATIGVASRTNNANLRSVAIGAIPGAIFGITEPIIYAVNLPKVKPFFAGCVGAFFGGIIYTGVFQGNWFLPNAQGIFSFLSVQGGALQYIGWTLAILTSIGVGCLFTIMIYNDRPNELKNTKKMNKLFAKTYAIAYNKPLSEVDSQFKDEFDKLVSYLDKDKFKSISEWEKIMKDLVKASVVAQKANAKDEKQKDKLSKKANHAYSKKNYEMVRKYNELFNEVDKNSKAFELDKIYFQKQVEVNDIISNLNKFQNEYLLIVDNLLNSFSEHEFKDKILLLQNNYYNTIHSLDIAYQVSDKKDDEFNIKMIKKLQGEKLKNEKLKIS
ncbi:PTS glucose transporter subunit IIA [Spiroplasma alleghenense]|uniref:PTS system, beta-glucoside-specific IIABC component n=1 Tax=Spiroplasma alleghenense TaxID=216931 RepID=A0A345Z4Z9_9MOLU|nr:PTS glucose transporter subunit IIABC [Spiroplasma alleghenense]AXK51678.1 PTS system, beta-glucoside-specific IIABC component [Spiroplasma alleghenense]